MLFFPPESCLLHTQIQMPKCICWLKLWKIIFFLKRNSKYWSTPPKKIHWNIPLKHWMTFLGGNSQLAPSLWWSPGELCTSPYRISICQSHLTIQPWKKWDNDNTKTWVKNRYLYHLWNWEAKEVGLFPFHKHLAKFPH